MDNAFPEDRRGDHPIDHLRQLFVGKDRVDGDGFSLGDFLSQLSEFDEDGKIIRAEDLLVVFRSASVAAGIAGPWVAFQIVDAQRPEGIAPQVHPPSVDRKDSVAAKECVPFCFDRGVITHRKEKKFETHNSMRMSVCSLFD